MPGLTTLERAATIGTDVYPYRVYVPDGHYEQGDWPVILFLHGSGEGGRDGLRQSEVGLGPAIAADPERFPAVVVFPQSPRGQPWRGPSAELAVRALERTMEEFDIDRQRQYLIGVSMGAYGAYRLAMDEPLRFAALVGICGGLDTPGGRPLPTEIDDNMPPADTFLDAARLLRHLPIWLFHGDADQIVPVTESRALVEAASQVGGRLRYTEYPGFGHAIWKLALDDPDLMPWLLSQRNEGD
jgi:predicted peptidase